MLCTKPRWLIAVLASTIAAGAASAETIAELRANDNAASPHAQHLAAMRNSSVKIDRVAYAIPDVTLVDETGANSRLQDLLAVDRPVAVNFIFTSCTTICPVMTATMLQLQRQLDDASIKPHYISISIDPDFDSAGVMKEYANRFGADWTFLTGSQDNVMATLRAFDAYRGNKINHFALTLMRASDDAEWTRIEGLTSAEELARVWREITL
jgi:protein SCO1